MKTATFSLSPPLSSWELQSLWSLLNARYFENRLLPIEIQWSTRLTSSVGLFVSQSGPRIQWIAPEIRHGSGRVIRLSSPLLYRQSLAEIRGTLAHEMIHQWQFDVKKWNPSHGREFRRVMKIMNCDGLGITIYHTLNKEVEALSKCSWLCQRCGRSYHRQQKSLSSQNYRCGYCRSELRPSNQTTPSRSFHGTSKSKLQIGHGNLVSKPVQLAFGFMLP
ncbi:MAG: SprT-like domain-containing protein [Nitrospirota bacterium]|nr:SprT-like domain-containing protein [Nitrospirota bacterium]